jgi:hypothetical protein
MNPVIEPGIRPLVDAMNATGVFWTVASCEGHRWSGAPPYVYFVAPLEVAASLDVLLEEDIANEKRRLTYYWVVRGMFFRGQIRFHISPPNLAQRYFWRRRTLEADIHILVDLVLQLGQKLRQKYKPAIGNQDGGDRDRYHVPDENVLLPLSQTRHQLTASRTLPGGMTDASSAFATRYESHKHLLIPCSQQGILTQFAEVRS